jgi:hypothetical protein
LQFPAGKTALPLLRARQNLDMRHCVKFIVLLFLVSSAFGQTRSPHNGYWWNDLTPSFKMGAVTGFTLAMITVADTTEFECIAQKNGGKLPEKYRQKQI